MGPAATTPAVFEPWLRKWRLTPDGAPFTTTFGSHLMPVLSDGAAAMLKIAGGEEERQGAQLMAWWRGEGAARVLALAGEAVLLERVVGPRSLAVMARSGEDDGATAILTQTLARLHAPRDRPRPATLVPLPIWFRALAPMAEARGGVLALSLAASRELLASPQDEHVLHGDLHHDNVLDGGERGWLAIDPKGLIGERGFDHANILCNPDIATAAAPGRVRRRSQIVAAAAGLEPRRLLMWLLAYAGLSASWTLGDDGDASPALQLAEIAAVELGLAIPPPARPPGV